MIRYSSPLGNFFFDDMTLPSRAKLIRDTVVGQAFNPKPGHPRILDAKSAYEFIEDHPASVLAGIHFTLEMV